MGEEVRAGIAAVKHRRASTVGGVAKRALVPVGDSGSPRGTVAAQRRRMPIFSELNLEHRAVLNG
jgi:hypothetical protein